MLKRQGLVFGVGNCTYLAHFRIESRSSALGSNPGRAALQRSLFELTLANWPPVCRLLVEEAGGVAFRKGALGDRSGIVAGQRNCSFLEFRKSPNNPPRNFSKCARQLSRDMSEVSEWWLVACLLHKLTMGFAVIGVINAVLMPLFLANEMKQQQRVAPTDDRGRGFSAPAPP